jgi:hypothetical protein
MGKQFSCHAACSNLPLIKNIELLCSELKRKSNLRTVARSCKALEVPTVMTVDALNKCHRQRTKQLLFSIPEPMFSSIGNSCVYSETRNRESAIRATQSTEEFHKYRAVLFYNPKSPSIPHRLPRQPFHLPSNKSDRERYHHGERTGRGRQLTLAARRGVGDWVEKILRGGAPGLSVLEPPPDAAKREGGGGGGAAVGGPEGGRMRRASGIKTLSSRYLDFFCL